MKLKFKNQQFQTDAVNSVADLFKGQEKLRSTFEITNIEETNITNQGELGIGNVITISNDTLIANMHEIQRRNNLPTTSDILDDSGVTHRSFCVEMETGTGKTYVYTKTIFELNKQLNGDSCNCLRLSSPYFSTSIFIILVLFQKFFYSFCNRLCHKWRNSIPNLSKCCSSSAFKIIIVRERLYSGRLPYRY